MLMKKCYALFVCLSLLCSCSGDEGIIEEPTPVKEYVFDRIEFLDGEGNVEENYKDNCSDEDFKVFNGQSAFLDYTFPTYTKVKKDETVFEIETPFPAGFVLPDDLYVRIDKNGYISSELFSTIPQYTERIYHFGNGNKLKIPPYTMLEIDYSINVYKRYIPFRAIFQVKFSDETVELKGRWKEIVYGCFNEYSKLSNIAE